MSKLFENISSTDRRQLINEYSNNRSNKNIIINKNKNNYNSINNYNQNMNVNKIRKNYSLLNKGRDSNISNISNISHNRNIARNYISTDNNNFDNNYFSSRPKTPIYGMINKNYNDNYINNLNNLNTKKTIVNSNTNKLAYKHFMRIQKMMNDYNNKNRINLNYNEIKNDCFDRNKLYKMNQINYKPSKKIIFSTENKNQKFTSINDCTFNNYLKNLN